MRPFGIAAPSRAADSAASLGQKRIIHCNHQRVVRSQGAFDLLPCGGKQGFRLGSALTVEPVVGSPILLVPVLGCEQTGESMTSQHGQLRQGMGGVTGRL
mgnify:CR=1 FL=1